MVNIGLIPCIGCLAIFLLLFAHTPVKSAPLTIGVITHFAFGKTDRKQMASWLDGAGVSSIRDELYWAQVERDAGSYKFTGNSIYAFENLTRLGKIVKPLVILDYGNPAYDGGGLPYSPAGVEGFAGYATWVVGQSKGFTDTFELWNEWDIGSGGDKKRRWGSPERYVALAKATYVSVKRDHPNAQIIVGAVADANRDWSWLKSAISLGLLKWADGISVHLYNHCDSRKVGSDDAIKRLDELHQILSFQGYRLPIYVTEVGWPTHQGKCGVDELSAAQYSFRFMLESSTRDWLNGIWFYEFMDSGTDPAEREHRFGLLTRSGKEKPAGCFVREMSEMVSKRPIRYITQGRIKLAAFRGNGKDFFVLWQKQTPDDQKIQVELNEEAKLTINELCGYEPVAIEVDGKKFTATLSGNSPLVITVGSGVEVKSIGVVKNASNESWWRLFVN